MNRSYYHHLQQAIAQINRALIFNDDAARDEMLCMITEKPTLTPDGYLRLTINNIPCYESFIKNCSRARIYIHRKGVRYSVEAEGACEPEPSAEHDKLKMRIKLRHVALKGSAALTWRNMLTNYWERVRMAWNSIWMIHTKPLGTSL